MQEPLEVSPVALIPQPQQIAFDSGYFVIDAKTQISVENQQQVAVARHFSERFLKPSGWVPDIQQQHASATIQLSTDPVLPNEGYRLTVTDKSVNVQASSNAGFFYGFQTLMQLLPPEFVSGQELKTEKWAIPAITIEDAPAFEWRGFMLDVSRHFFDVDQVKEILDIMAGLKMNRFHWHLTDDQGWRIEIKSYPRVT